jgi:hypothetical protein
MGDAGRRTRVWPSGGFVRTLVVAAIGLVLAAAVVLSAGYLGKNRMAGALLFIAVWFVFCAVDYSNGVKAGFGPLEELGIHLVIFMLPTIGAWATTRYLP